MAPYAKWTLRIELLETRLAVGVYDHERSAQPVFVSVRADGWASAEPNALYQCLDYEPICRWITEQWPLSEHTPLLETRVDRKSTRLNSSHHSISYAVFCLKKKNHKMVPDDVQKSRLILIELDKARQGI